MKNLVIVLALLGSSLATISQDTIPTFKLEQTGYSSLVFKADSLTAKEIYNKALSWVHKTYKNPDKVITGKLEGESISLNGYSSNAWSYTSMGMPFSYDMRYNMYIKVKDGRYQVTYEINTFYLSSAGAPVSYVYTSFYKNNGDKRKSYNTAWETMDATVNSMSMSLNDDIVNGESTPDTGDDW